MSERREDERKTRREETITEDERKIINEAGREAKGKDHEREENKT
jgi:hypothetical protein